VRTLCTRYNGQILYGTHVFCGGPQRADMFSERYINAVASPLGVTVAYESILLLNTILTANVLILF